VLALGALACVGPLSFVPWGMPTAAAALGALAACALAWRLRGIGTPLPSSQAIAVLPSSDTSAALPSSDTSAVLPWVAAGLLLYFMSFLPAVIWQGDALRTLDKPVRLALLALAAVGLHRWLAHGGGQPLRDHGSDALALGLTASGVTALGYALWDLGVNGAQRVGGFMNAIQFGVLAVSVAVMALAVGLMGRWRDGWLSMGRRRSVLAMGALCAAAAAWWTASLTAVLGALVVLPLGLAWCVWLWRGRMARVQAGRSSPSVAIAVAVAMAIAGMAAVAQSDQWQARMSGAVAQAQAFAGGDAESSNGARLANWVNAWQFFESAPWVGHGYAHYLAERENQAARGELAPYASTFQNAHNEYLHALATRGLLGGLGLVALGLLPGWGFVRALRQARLPAAGSPRPATSGVAWAGVMLLGTFALAGLTQNVLAHGSGVVFLGSGLVVLAALCDAWAPSVPANAPRRETG
jgi:O-antigen ligase